MNGEVPNDFGLGDFLYADNGTVSTTEILHAALVETIQDCGDGNSLSDTDALFTMPTVRKVMDAWDVLHRHVGLQDDEAISDDLQSTTNFPDTRFFRHSQ